MKKIILSLTIFILLINFNFKDVKANYKPDINILAESYLLINMDNEQTLLEKDIDKKMYPASLTKIMTAIIVLENVNDIDQTTFTATQGLFDEFFGLDISNADIRIGETLTVRQLLYASLLQSANEAANILAYNVGDKNIDKFVKMMNNKAKEIGANNTNYVNPHGLFSENQYTTASDLYKITKYALSIPIFKEIVSKSKYPVPQTNKHEPRILSTTLLMQDKNNGGKYYRSYIKGVKTGTLPEAGRCLVTSAEINKSNYICIVLNSPLKDAAGKPYQDNMSFIDSINMYEWLQSSLKTEKVAETDKAITETNIQLSKNKDHVLLYPDKNFSLLIPKDSNESVIKKNIILNENLKAPIKSGQIIGKCQFLLFDKVLGEVNLISSENIDVSYVLLIADIIKRALSSIWAKIISILIIFSIALYIITMIKTNKKRTYKIRKQR